MNSYETTHRKFASWLQRLTSDHGSTLPLILGFLAVTLAATAVVTDISYARQQHLRLQSLADDVALESVLALDSAATAEATGAPVVRVQLDRAQAFARARTQVARQAAEWNSLHIAAISVRNRALQIRLCADVVLPLTSNLLPSGSARAARGSGSITSSAHTVCASAAAAFVVRVPQ